MSDPVYPLKPVKESNALVDYILIASGVLFMVVAIGLLALFMVRHGRVTTANSPMGNEGFVYDGKQIYHVPAGSRQIDALAYSSQAPVVVMFDADW